MDEEPTAVYLETSESSLKIALIIILFASILLGTITIAYYRWGWPYQSAHIGVGLLGAVASIALALGIYFQAIQNQDVIRQNEALIRNSRQQSVVLQESELLPHFYPTWGDFKLITCSGPKPWLPWMKAEIEGDSNEDWYEENSYPVMDDAEIVPGNVSKAMEFYDIDWFVPFRDEIHQYFRDGISEETRGKLYFKFETLTGTWYLFEYTLILTPNGDDYNIQAVPEVTRYLPWQDSQRRDVLVRELKGEIQQGSAHFLHDPIHSNSAKRSGG